MLPKLSYVKVKSNKCGYCLQKITEFITNKNNFLIAFNHNNYYRDLFLISLHFQLRYCITFVTLQVKPL